MSNNILVKDNFFNSVDELRELALSFKFMPRKQVPWDIKGGWRGYRTGELSYYDIPLLNECVENILKTTSDFFNLTDYDFIRFFHITYEKDMKNQIAKWHKDESVYAGVLYLTPDPPKETGTTIFHDGERIEVENKYNRLIAYHGNWKHGPTNFFGDTHDNARLTMTFFMNPSDIMRASRISEQHQYDLYDKFCRSNS